MNSFVEHHAKLIRFAYSCFDRILFNVFLPAWQCAAVLVGLLTKTRGVSAIQSFSVQSGAANCFKIKAAWRQCTPS